MSDQLSDLVEFRLAAIEVVLIDLIANAYLTHSDPKKSIASYRERFKNMSANNMIPNDDANYSILLTGETFDAVDKLAERIQNTVIGRLPKQE
jgi:hypothetical protein